MLINFLHLHPNRINRNYKIFLLALPAIVFALVLAILLSQQLKKEVASVEAPHVSP